MHKLVVAKQQSSFTVSSQTAGDRIFDAINIAFMCLVLFITAYPLYFILVASVSDPTYVLNGETFLFPKGFTLEGILYLLKQQKVWTGYQNTILYTLVGTTCNLVFTLPVAYALSRKDFSSRGIIMFIFTFTVMFSGGLMPTYLTVKDLHMLDSMWAIILPNAIFVWNLIVARSFFEGIPQELADAAAIDGCSDFKMFLQVMLPISNAMIAVIALYYAVGHWNMYFDAMIYLKSPEKFTLQLFLREILIENQRAASSGDGGYDAQQAMKMADLIKYSLIIVSTAPLMIVYPFVQKYFVKGVMVGAVKG